MGTKCGKLNALFTQGTDSKNMYKLNNQVRSDDTRQQKHCVQEPVLEILENGKEVIQTHIFSV
jgi:hypothetical protein